MISREKLEVRIINILTYIHHPVVFLLQKNLNIFSTPELLQIYEYLETGSLNSIYQFMEDKKQEYIDIINSLKIKKRYANLSQIRLQEKLEIENEQQKIDIIDFNF